MSNEDFLLEEYKSRTQEIQGLMKEARQLELYSGAAVAALYSWFATTQLTNTFAWYLPLIIPVLGLIRSWAFYARVKQIAEYVKKIEVHIFSNENQLKGWENWYAEIDKHNITPTGILFWLVLICVCIVFPFLYM